MTVAESKGVPGAKTWRSWGRVIYWSCWAAQGPGGGSALPSYLVLSLFLCTNTQRRSGKSNNSCLTRSTAIQLGLVERGLSMQHSVRLTVLSSTKVSWWSGGECVEEARAFSTVNSCSKFSFCITTILEENLYVIPSQEEAMLRYCNDKTLDRAIPREPSSWSRTSFFVQLTEDAHSGPGCRHGRQF